MDGHTTHENDQIENFCIANLIEVQILPAHSSHITQPLDVSVFRSVKQVFRRLYRDYEISDDEIPTTSATMRERRRLLSTFHQALRQVRGDYKIIVHGFKNTGIYPFDYHILLNNPLIANPFDSGPKQCKVMNILYYSSIMHINNSKRK